MELRTIPVMLILRKDFFGDRSALRDRRAKTSPMTPQIRP